jgi:hypothetical protein
VSLWRTILDAHGRQILEYASDQFLDLAMARRLETIKAGDLVSMLAKADRLGHSEVDVVDDDETVRPVHESPGIALSRVNAISTSTPPGDMVSQSGSDSTDSPRPSAIEGPRGPKRLKTNIHGSLLVKGPCRTSNGYAVRPGPAPLSRQGSCGAETSPRAAGKPGRGSPVLPSGNVLKRQSMWPGVRTKCRPETHGAPPQTRQRQGISAHYIGVVVISDSEP